MSIAPLHAEEDGRADAKTPLHGSSVHRRHVHVGGKERENSIFGASATVMFAFFLICKLDSGCKGLKECQKKTIFLARFSIPSHS